MKEDLHKKLAVVILLVIIVISALGTWTILTTTTTRQLTINENPLTTGKVSVTILPQQQPEVNIGDETP